MSRYVSADELIRRYESCGFVKVGVEDFPQTIDIVRCKDCKYWSEQDKKSPFYRGTDCIRYGGMGMATADDFCSYGEVRDE